MKISINYIICPLVLFFSPHAARAQVIDMTQKFDSRNLLNSGAYVDFSSDDMKIILRDTSGAKGTASVWTIDGKLLRSHEVHNYSQYNSANIAFVDGKSKSYFADSGYLYEVDLSKDVITRRTDFFKNKAFHTQIAIDEKGENIYFVRFTPFHLVLSKQTLNGAGTAIEKLKIKVPKLDYIFFSNYGKYLALSLRTQKEEFVLQILSTETGMIVKELVLSANVTASFCDDKKAFLALGLADGQVVFYDLRKDIDPVKFQFSNFSITSIYMHPRKDDLLFFTSCDSRGDDNFCVFNIKAQSKLRSVKFEILAIIHSAINRKGNKIVYVTNEYMRIIDVSEFIID